MIGGLSGDRMLLGLAIGIIVLIFLVLKTKVQAFLALIISTIIVGGCRRHAFDKHHIRRRKNIWHHQFHHHWLWRYTGQHWYHHRLRCHDGADI